MCAKVIFLYFRVNRSPGSALFATRTADVSQAVVYGDEIAMGRLGTESFDEFLSSLKRLGIVIRNELELRERMAEARRWRYA